MLMFAKAVQIWISKRGFYRRERTEVNNVDLLSFNLMIEQLIKLILVTVILATSIG